jgi:L-ascorbate metabolism protein UlaG (beta-lactamase superfamily)
MNHSLHLTHVGHATILIEMDGVRLLTDPLLRDRVSLLRRLSNPIDPTSYQDIDAILISHFHLDHLDLPSLHLLGNSKRMIVPYGIAEFLRRHGFENIEEMRVGDTKTIGTLSVEAIYAEHKSTRFPFGPAADCLGFLITGRYRIYFAGDTGLFPSMKDLTDDLDVALLPVWGWGPRLGAGHMTPYCAAQALTLLRPHMAVPIHWGTLVPLGLGWINPSFLTQPPHSFTRYAAQLTPQVRVQVIIPGSSISYEGGVHDGFV